MSFVLNASIIIMMMSLDDLVDLLDRQTLFIIATIMSVL